MEVVVASHSSATAHDTGPHHPERPARVGAVLKGIAECGLGLVKIEAPRISRSDLALVHDPSYIENIESFCLSGGGALDMDTFVSPESWEAALTAAGGVKATVEALVDLEDAVGFAVTRPPGHHALRSHAMGFCLFNNVAVTAAWLRANGNRVAILDWDVHHGNGTQAMLGPDPDVLYASIHEGAFYPFEGFVEDIDHDAKGTILNIPLDAGTAGDIYRQAWTGLVIPVLTEFAPDWVLVSAGYDGHVGDPLADMRLTADDYGWMAARLAAVHPPHRTVFALEGGYDLDALRASVRATLVGASGIDEFDPPLTSPPGAGVRLDKARLAISRHWRI
ncbi:MAG: histone deacetylase [Acidimicrobiia bacterium]